MFISHIYCKPEYTAGPSGYIYKNTNQNYKTKKQKKTLRKRNKAPIEIRVVDKHKEDQNYINIYPPKKDKTYSNKKVFNLFLIRHGEAEHNIYKYRNPWLKIFKDPKLTLNGISNSEEASEIFEKRLEEEDLILNKKNTLFISSPSRRCRETIVKMFKKYIDKENKVHVMPYLLEIPSKIKYRLPENSIPEKISKNVSFNYSFVEKNGFYKKNASESNIEKGLEFIFENLDKILDTKKIEKIENIIIMTHSKILKKYFTKSLKLNLPKPLNNGSYIIKVEYDSNFKKYKIVSLPMVFTNGYNKKIIKNFKL